MELNIKHEPAVDFVLFLPSPTEVKRENNPFGIRPCSVNLRMSDTKWRNEANMFKVYYTCKNCEFISRSNSYRDGKEFVDHMMKCDKKCKYCGREFKSCGKMLSHSKAKKRKCRSCVLEFECYTYWMEHKQEHHQNGFKCNQCSYIATSLRRFNIHYAQHTKKFACETCSGSFSRKYRLKEHQVQHQHGTHKSGENIFECDECKKSFRTQKALCAHQLRRHGTKMLECDICGHMLKGKANMISHLMTHIKEECKFCGKTFNIIRMPHHVNLEHIKSERAMTCKDCGRRFLDKPAFDYHINAKPIDCPSCQESFKCRILWTQHQKEQHPEGLKCSQCSFVGKSGASLRYHLKLFHIKNFACVSCPKKFGYKRLLENHQKISKHGAFENLKIEALKCKKCEKVYLTSRSLNRHKIIAHKFWNVECDICGKNLSRKTNLINHFATHMSEECQMCGKLLTKSEMPKHLFRIHSKAVDPHSQCKDCGASFFDNRSYSSHINAKRKKCFPCKIEFRCCGLWKEHKMELH